MSNETARVIEKQIDLMRIDLDIVLQKLKIKELNIRASVLNAKADVEGHKLRGLKELRDEKKTNKKVVK